METLTVSALPAAPSRTRLAGWLLALQPLAWIGVIVGGLANFPPGTFESWTPEVMAGIRGPWILFHLFIALAFVMGNAGLALVAAGLRESRARLPALAALVCAIGGIALIAVIAGLRWSVASFTEPTLGQVAAYRASDPIFIPAAALSVLATLATGVSLWQTGLARRTGLVVAVLAGLLLVLSFFVGGPPFVLGLLWLPLGIALLVGRRQA
jgi:hypothetical protein